MVPVSPSLTMPRCLAYQARRASGFSDLKKIPPIPRTRAMGGMLRDRYHLNQQVRKRSPEGQFKAGRLRMHCLFRFELRWVFHICPILRRKGGSCLLVSARDLFRMVDVVKKEDAHIKRCARKYPKSCRERRPARAARRRNVLGKMDSIHAAAAKGFVGILHQPEAVAAVLNHVGGDRHPLAFIRGRRSLAIPELRLWHGHSVVRDAIGIHADSRQAMLISEALYLGE